MKGKGWWVGIESRKGTEWKGEGGGGYGIERRIGTAWKRNKSKNNLKRRQYHKIYFLRLLTLEFDQ